MKQMTLNLTLAGVPMSKRFNPNYLGWLLKSPELKLGSLSLSRLSNCLNDLSATEWDQFTGLASVKAYIEETLAVIRSGEGDGESVPPSAPGGWSTEEPLLLNLAGLVQLARCYFGPDLGQLDSLDPKIETPEYVDEFYRLYSEHVGYIPELFEDCSFVIEGDPAREEHLIFGTFDSDDILETHIRSVFAFGTVPQAVEFFKTMESGYDIPPTLGLMTAIWSGRVDIFEACLDHIEMDTFANDELPKLVGATSRFLPFANAIVAKWPEHLSTLFNEKVVLPILETGDLNTLAMLQRTQCLVPHTAKLKLLAQGLGFDDLAGWF